MRGKRVKGLRRALRDRLTKATSKNIKSALRQVKRQWNLLPKDKRNEN